MTAVPQPPAAQARPGPLAGLRMTASEYLAQGETAERYELIDGVVLMSPSAAPGHNEIVSEIVYQIKACARGGAPVRVFPETDIRVSETLVYRPDVAVYAASRLPRGTPSLQAPPDLVVEVLSPTTRALDLVTKRGDYERFGVGEYWVVDPTSGRTRCFRRQDGRLVESEVGGDSLACASLPGVTLDLAALKRLVESL